MFRSLIIGSILVTTFLQNSRAQIEVDLQFYGATFQKPKSEITIKITQEGKELQVVYSGRANYQDLKFSYCKSASSLLLQIYVKYRKEKSFEYMIPLSDSVILHKIKIKPSLHLRDCDIEIIEYYQDLPNVWLTEKKKHKIGDHPLFTLGNNSIDTIYCYDSEEFFAGCS